MFGSFGAKFSNLNNSLHKFKEDLMEKAEELFDEKLSQSNIKYNLVNEGESLKIEADEIVLNKIQNAEYDNLNDAVDDFVDEVMETEPEEFDADVYEPLDTSNVGAIETWIVEVKLEKAENIDEKRRVYESPNPHLEVSKIAMRIIRAQQRRKRLNAEIDQYGGR